MGPRVLSWTHTYLTVKPVLSAILQDGGSPALVAAWDGHLEALRLLFAAGANPAAVDRVRRGWRLSRSSFECLSSVAGLRQPCTVQVFTSWRQAGSVLTYHTAPP